MTNIHSDTHVPAHIVQAVGSSQTVQGDFIQLSGAQAVSIQVLLTNGAAGTLYLEGTNQQGQAAIVQQVTNSAIAANGSALLTFSLVDPITSMHKMRCRFVSSAAGNVVVAVNLRCNVN